MSTNTFTSFASDEKFATDIIKGNLAELLFERLAVHSGWFVKYTGDQYSNPISPKTKHVVGGQHVPDFRISKTIDFKKSYSVEIKFQLNFDKRKSVHEKGHEDIRVVISPSGHAIYPPAKANELGISEQDWNHAKSLIKRIQPGS